MNRPLVIYRNNGVKKVSIEANGDMFATSFSPISSRTLKDNIVDLDLETATTALRELTPVEFIYKDDPTAKQRLGFIAEDVPEIIANADRKSVPLMDTVALVTRVVKGQQSDLKLRATTIDDQAKLIESQQMTLAGQMRTLELNRADLNNGRKQVEDDTASLNEMRMRLKRLERKLP